MKVWKLYLFLLFFGILFFGWNYFVQKEKINTPKQKPKEVAQKIEKPKIVKLAMVGDVLIHSRVYKDAKNKNGAYDFKPMFSEVKKVFSNYDLIFANQESIIGGKKIGLSTYPRFNSPEEIGEALVDAGVNIISTANNHSLDKNFIGIKNSLNFWGKQKNIIYSGTFQNQEERDKIKYFEKNGIKFAFLSYTAILNGLKPKYDFEVAVWDKEKIKKELLEARKRADIILFSIHWGQEYLHKPTKEQRAKAKFLAENGVDIIIGTHSHTIQPIEKIGNTIVFYSLGNFISSQIGVARKVGLLGNVVIEKKENQVVIKDVGGKLFYTFSKNNHHFQVIPFEKMNETYLKKWKNIEKKYLQIVGVEKMNEKKAQNRSTEN